MHNRNLLRRITDHDAIIIHDDRSGYATYAAYPYGDRRRRPISWIEKAVFQKFLSEGLIAKCGKGYAVVKSAAARAQSVSDQPHAAQHRDMHTRTITDVHGRFRAARVNRNSTGLLRRLARRKTASGQPFLSDPQVQAGEQFSSDYARSTLAIGITQNYMNVGGGQSAGNGAETASLEAINAKDRVMDALQFVGSPLDKAILACCTQDMGLEELERTQGWAQRSGGTVLKIALERLADFYGTTPGRSRARH